MARHAVIVLLTGLDGLAANYPPDAVEVDLHRFKHRLDTHKTYRRRNGAERIDTVPSFLVSGGCAEPDAWPA